MEIHVAAIPNDLRCEIARRSRDNARHCQRGGGRGSSVGLHEAEIEHLDEIVVRTEATHENVSRRHITVNEALRVRFAERVADLLQEIDHPTRFYRAELTD